MKINRINNLNSVYYSKNNAKSEHSGSVKYESNSNVLSHQLNSLAYANKYMTALSFKGALDSEEKNFKLNLNFDELKRRTSPDNFAAYTLIDENNDAYKKLSQGDKTALKHLVKAAKILEEVYLVQDNPHNIEFKNYLEEQTLKGNEQARLTLQLFNAQKALMQKILKAAA